MRLTQTTVIVLSYMKLLQIFESTVNDKTIKRIVKLIIWNYFSFYIIVWLYQSIIESFVLRHPKTQFLFSWKACKVYKCQYSFPFLHQSWIVGWWNFSLLQCVCNNFVQDICFLIDFLLEINKMIFVLYPLEIGQLLFKNSKKTNHI